MRSVVTQEVQSKVHMVTCLWACPYILIHHRGVSPSQTKSASGIQVIHAEESTGWDSESSWIESRRKKGKCDTGYVFHNSCGIESGSTKELETQREFILHKCAEKQLQKKLHAIWFVQLPFPWLRQLTVLVDLLVSGTASPWVAINQGLIWGFIRTYARTRMVYY